LLEPDNANFDAVFGQRLAPPEDQRERENYRDREERNLVDAYAVHAGALAGSVAGMVAVTRGFVPP
jgi:hypothetical protein